MRFLNPALSPEFWNYVKAAYDSLIDGFSFSKISERYAEHRNRHTAEAVHQALSADPRFRDLSERISGLEQTVTGDFIAKKDKDNHYQGIMAREVLRYKNPQALQMQQTQDFEYPGQYKKPTPLTHSSVEGMRTVEESVVKHLLSTNPVEGLDAPTKTKLFEQAGHIAGAHFATLPKLGNRPLPEKELQHFAHTVAEKAVESLPEKDRAKAGAELERSIKTLVAEQYSALSALYPDIKTYQRAIQVSTEQYTSKAPSSPAPSSTPGAPPVTPPPPKPAITPGR